MARVILAVAEMPEPPLRLLLGGDAHEMGLACDERRLAETLKWQALTLSTDVDRDPGASPA